MCPRCSRGSAHCPRRITSDSRASEPGVAFAAYPGTRADGRRSFPTPSRAARPRCCGKRGRCSGKRSGLAPNLGVDGLQARLGYIADFIYGSPSQRLWMIGVTGTNGKTSCAHWIAQALDACGRRAAADRDARQRFRRRSRRQRRNTTPDATVVHEMLKQFHDAGATAVAMEVSSHGLDQGRVNGVKFDVALFTNLTRDHLDYHKTMAAYGAAKARLFTWPGLRAAVINADDPFGQSLIDAARAAGQRLLTYGFANARHRRHDQHDRSRGIVLDVATPWGKATLTSAVVGAFNAQNLLGVLGVLLASDVPLAAATTALGAPRVRRRAACSGWAATASRSSSSTTRTRPTRSRRCCRRCCPAVAEGRELVCVFGCGGDRDPGKRPQMGAHRGRAGRPRRRHQRQSARRGPGGHRERGRQRGFASIDIAAGRSRTIAAPRSPARSQRRKPAISC